ncbi:MAG: hypothetical protein R3191_07830 [Anaerolineales bacterium]|nr:hypothetical protein [Anaerolineales bacterium]
MDKPVDVEADLSVAPPRPRSFRWGDRRLVVADIGRRWTDEQGRQHYLVRTDAGQVFELAYLADKATWRLVRTPGHFTGPKTRV